MTTAASWLAPVIIAAALVVRTAIGELRRPGSARQEWVFVTDGTALAGGAVAGAAVIWLGWSQAGPAAVAWALLVGTLTAHMVHHGRPRP
jgi:hypothetical protein